MATSLCEPKIDLINEVPLRWAPPMKILTL